MCACVCVCAPVSCALVYLVFEQFFKCGGDAGMRRRGVLAVAVAVMVVTVVCGEEQNQGQECKAQRTCAQCIQTAGCAWCINPKSGEHCQSAQDFTKATCSISDIQNPKNAFQLVQDEELTGAIQKKHDLEENIYQLKPQRVKLQLRRGVPQNLDIKYRRALGYPVDLYYLMDLSNSMDDDKKHLAEAGAALVQTMMNLTSQFTIGFGSFVDKVMMPFTDTTHAQRQSPCTDCAPPYSFRNDMRLSTDHAAFKQRVTDAKISGNLDHPEGGFDALMQAMVCKDQIGWREKVRHILVFSTDAKFHHAGDGRLAGVVMPNDEKCHLDEHHEYTHFDRYDYPSIAQINRVAEEMNINIIFAVLQHEELYRELQKEIKTSSFGLLDEGSKNVVDLIKDQYNSISSSLSLSDNSTNAITIKYSSTCTDGKLRETKECAGIGEDDEITFNLEITVNKCPVNGERSFVEVKTLEASVILEIEYLCDCNCPASTSTSPCKNNGELECGVCLCPDGYYGEECQCVSGDESSLSDIQDQTAKCMANETDSRVCSGRGNCKCGICECFKPDEVSGTFCQCHKRRCMGSSDVECSGRGTCNCNECICNEGYSGQFCECEDRSCIPQGSDKVCSGHGRCECDRCICDQENITYTGRYCEDCLSCGTGKCKKFRDCVQCVHFKIGPLKDNCDACEQYASVENLDDYMYENSRLCTFEDEDGCYLNFTYRYLESTNKDEVHVQAERKCRKEPPIALIVFGLIATIVLVGVLTLIMWKIVTTIHDKREFAKFLEETKQTRFGAEQNPLFIDPTTTTQNPMFEGARN